MKNSSDDTHDPSHKEDCAYSQTSRTSPVSHSPRQGFLHGISASLLDQALLSLFNLAIGMVFIRFASKGDYALYAQLMALVFLTTSVQSALINSPALTLLPRKSLDERKTFAGSLFTLQAILSLAFAIIFGLLALFAPKLLSLGDISNSLALAFALVIWVAWLRDFVRNQLFVDLKASACLKLDLVYATICVAGFGTLIASETVLADHVMLLLGIAGGLTAIPWLINAAIHFHADSAQTKAALREAWALARWSLPGGIVSWAFGNGYVLISAQIVGPEATADIVAARLFVAPLGMAYLAWGNVFRPRAGHWIAAGQSDTVTRVSYGAIIGISCGVLLYLGALVLAYPMLEQHLLGQKYQGLVQDIAWWGGFFLASGVAGIGTGVLLALGRFRDTFLAATAGCLISLPLMFILGGALGKNGILLGLTIGEAVTAAWLFFAMRLGLKNMTAVPVAP
jgi:O-antigen/teichoic acid export membrane protein